MMRLSLLRGRHRDPLHCKVSQALKFVEGLLTVDNTPRGQHTPAKCLCYPATFWPTIANSADIGLFFSCFRLQPAF